MSGRSVGRLRRRLVALEPLDVDDDIGGRSRNFEERFEIWAEIEPLASTRRFLAQREEVEATHRIRIRSGSLVAAGWRLREGDRLFDLIAVGRDETASGFISCVAKETT